MYKLFSILLFIAFVNAITNDELNNELEWNEFKLKYNKEYKDETEENIRKLNYFNNKAKVIEHNSFQENNSNNILWTASLNKYSDMSWDEFNSKLNRLKPELKIPSEEVFKATKDFQAPDELDYRTKGYVTEVKDQGSCGSCWAFSATGSLEGQIFKKEKKLISLSEQNLVDCSSKYGNEGCNGGLMDSAFNYIKENHGIDTEKSYPYEAEDGKCRFNEKTKGAEDTGFVDIEAHSDDALMQALVEKGPISVAIYADFKFQLYKSGVFESSGCMGMGLNHGVLLVGYGTDKKTSKKYWLVKNSWGTSWGEEGYIKMSREVKDNCGISTMSSYPTV